MYKKLIPIAAAAATALSLNAFALDMFLKVEGIEGESEDATHKGEIDVLSWSWGMSNSGSFHTGAGGGAGAPNFSDISLVKYIDKATVPLMQSVATGKHVTTATLVVRKTGADPLEFMRIEMTDVLVTSVSSGSSSGEARPTESISLNFGKFCTEYTPTNPDGTAGSSTKFCFDIAANETK